uniref:Uncharacterized protein n=1 Tax=Arundo donax TaxID=35708 RepID=A0A0A9GYW6_ARUDO
MAGTSNRSSTRGRRVPDRGQERRRRLVEARVLQDGRCSTSQCCWVCRVDRGAEQGATAAVGCTAEDGDGGRTVHVPSRRRPARFIR